MTTIIKILINAGAIYLTAYLLEAIQVSDFAVALLVALVLGIINITIRPLLKLLTFPITILTLGLSLFVLNGLMLWITSLLIAGFTIASFWWAILGSLLISFFVALGEAILGIE